MEKYGVETPICPNIKTGSADESKTESAVCPDCGRDVAFLNILRTTGVTICPACGTKPFERE